MNRRMGYSVLPLLLVVLLAACDAVDRMRGRADQQATAAAGGLALALQIPGMLRAGEEGTVRLSLTNRGDSIPDNLRLDLIIPDWMELAPPRPGDREVTMAASDDGTRFSYRMDEPPLEPGATQILEQRVRVPSASAASAGRGPESRLIRARLVNAQGQTLTEVQAEVSLDSAFLAASRTAAEAEAAAEDSAAAESGEAAAGATREQLGPVRLGMSVGELRQAASGARDTTWSQEGMTERGVVVPVEGGEALALISGDSVLRIHVDGPGPRTREGTGVGTTMQELRGHYGRACAAAGEGMVVVWFPAAPGISYALDVPFSSVQQVRQDPTRIPDTARVTRWWLRRGTDDCPATGG